MKQIEKVLVTGGAGFIGSFTVDLLVERGYEVTILDNLEAQVHGENIPEYLNREARFLRGDIRDEGLLKEFTKETDAIIHLASAVGVGQSMYQIDKYVDYNTRGTAILLNVLVNEENGVQKLVVASSMSIYGEGKYYCDKCSEYRFPRLRSEEELRAKRWDSLCPRCKTTLKPAPTDEDKPLMPTSIYAQTKRHQEEACLLVGRTYGIPTVALRYFNVYGPRQALSNPYTGVCAIFLSRILSGKPPYVFEDGNQTRDFVHVKDVAKANLLALERSSADYQAVNVGTGKPSSISEVAKSLIGAHGTKLEPHITGRYRKGDIRHCYADLIKARKLLGYEPSIGFGEGLKELTGWAKAQEWGAVDLFEKTLEELEKRKLAN